MFLWRTTQVDVYSINSQNSGNIVIDYADFFSITFGFNSTATTEYGSQVRNVTQGVVQTRLTENLGEIYSWQATNITSISECHGNPGDTYVFYGGGNTGWTGLLFILPIKTLNWKGTIYEM